MSLGLVLLLWSSGCGTPQERYETLRFFFDGVPDPNAPKVAATRPAGSEAENGPVVVTATVVSRHKPYVEGKCNSCHTSSAGMIMEFDEAYKQCVKCHTKVTSAHPRMHGPVALALCQWCHAPHDSAYPHLLKDDPIKVCTQCHDQQLLSGTPPQHQDGHSSCISCHFGHGAAERNFLKPEGHVDWPVPHPATMPGMQPETRPALEEQGP